MIRSRAAARVPAGLALLVLVLVLVLAAGNVLAKDSPAVTTKAAGAGGLSLRVELPAAVEPWQTLVAVPAGKRVELSTAATGVSLGSPAVMHGVQVVPLVVQPDKSAPRGLDLDLAFVADPGAPRPQRQRIAATFARLIESQALGGAAVRQEFEEVPGTYLMIITSTTGAAAAVEPLLEWRRQQGYTVQAVTTQTTGTSTAQILAYIQQVYDTAEDPLAYVCLAGDANGTCPVATWHESVSGYNGEGDHYYTTLEGGDDLSDVHLGRLSARSVVELSNIVQKILRYEREPDLATDPGWYSRALLVGDQSSSGETTIYVNQWLKEELQHRGYAQIDTVFASPFASQITAKFNQGISAYAYRGYIGMSGFSTGYIDNLANAGELAFAIMPTCGSGSFAAATHTYSEAMLRNPTGAAIGAIGTATSGTHTRYNNCYFHGAWEGAVNERDRHLGYAHTRGKLELFRQYGVGEPSIPEIWSVWNNLMGDPATEMRQALPTVPVVTYPAVVPAAAGTIPVTVTRPGGEPLAGARVALYRDSSLRSSGVTGEAGEVLLPLPAGAGAGAVQVTVTGDDLFPHRGSLLIGAVTTYCVQDGWIWSDGADGMPDPGETADLTVQIRNLGDQAATAVVTSLAAASAGVQVAGGDVVVDSVPAGAVVPAGPWTVSLAADVPDGEDAILSLAAVAGGETWQSRVDLPVSAPAFVVDAIQWSGAPGWSGSLQVTLRNAGSTPAVGAVATFTTASGFLILTGPVAAALGNVPTAGTALAPFQLAVSADAWGGYLAPCALTVTTATGTRQVIELPLTVGVGSLDSPVGPGTLGYLAWDEQDPSPDAPVFWWREIDPNHGGAGTDVGLTDFGAAQDDTRTFDLPFAFRYHGADYDRISICSNGWAALGQTYFQDWRNWGLPAAGAPDPLLAPFWDDLLQSGTNRVYHDYDAAAGVYVVQWSRMRNDVNGQQNFELLLYDPLVHPTATGDGLIVFQYQQVTNNDSSRGYATAGIQDGPDGLTWTYFNRYATGARSLAAGRAIAWVPAAPAIPAAMSVSPASFSVVLEPDQTRAHADDREHGPGGIDPRLAARRAGERGDRRARRGGTRAYDHRARAQWRRGLGRRAEPYRVLVRRRRRGAGDAPARSRSGRRLGDARLEPGRRDRVVDVAGHGSGQRDLPRPRARRGRRADQRRERRRVRDRGRGVLGDSRSGGWRDARRIGGADPADDRRERSRAGRLRSRSGRDVEWRRAGRGAGAPGGGHGDASPRGRRGPRARPERAEPVQPADGDRLRAAARRERPPADPRPARAPRAHAARRPAGGGTARGRVRRQERRRPAAGLGNLRLPAGGRGRAAQPAPDPREVIRGGGSSPETDDPLGPGRQRPGPPSGRLPPARRGPGDRRPARARDVPRRRYLISAMRPTAACSPLVTL